MTTRARDFCWSAGFPGLRKLHEGSSLSLYLCALLLTSCTTPSPESRTGELELDVPSTWTASSNKDAPVDNAWIDRFGDRKLSALVDEAMANNLNLKSAEARIAIAEANAKLAGADRKPTLDGSLSGGRQKQNFIGFPFGGGADSAPDAVSSSLSNRFGTSLDINWELDVWGRVRAGESAALAQLDATAADYDAARTSLAAQTAKTWFALIEAREQQALANETLKIFQDTETVIRDRFESGQADGSGTGAQLRLAMSDVATAEAAVEQTGERLATTVRQLETLLGRYPEGLLKGTATLPSPPSRPPSGLPSELLLRRPDFVAAERRFASSGAKRKEAVLSFFPRFALTGSSGTSSEDLENIVNSDFGVWSLAGNVVQPILSAGRLTAGLALRDAEERDALSQFQNTVLQGFSEVEIALAVEGYLSRSEAALSKAASLAGDADQQARDDYRDGVGDILTVLAAQNQFVTVRSQLITARRLRLDNRINLHLALGGDFRPRGKTPPASKKES